MASGDKCLPEEFMNRLRSGGKTLTPAGRPRRGARVTKQASGPDDQPMPEVEQVQAPPDWLDEVYQGGSRSGGADDGVGDRVMRLEPRGILRLFSRA
jgi:hypothetical protein